MRVWDRPSSDMSSTDTAFLSPVMPIANEPRKQNLFHVSAVGVEWWGGLHPQNLQHKPVSFCYTSVQVWYIVLITTEYGFPCHNGRRIANTSWFWRLIRMEQSHMIVKVILIKNYCSRRQTKIWSGLQHPQKSDGVHPFIGGLSGLEIQKGPLVKNGSHT
jgi:hypothetical protein